MQKVHERPGGGGVGDDCDISLLRMVGSTGVGAQHFGTLLAGQHALAVFTFIVILNDPNVLWHVFELVGQPLTLHLCQDSTLVVISACEHTGLLTLYNVLMCLVGMLNLKQMIEVLICAECLTLGLGPLFHSSYRVYSCVFPKVWTRPWSRPI